MALKISDKLKEQTSADIDWIRIQTFRNIIAHHYFGIDADEVWQIIHNKITGLKIQLMSLVEGTSQD